MKKLALLATAAVLSISGSAMAIDTGVTNRQILIEGQNAGTATFAFAFRSTRTFDGLLPLGSCVYSMRWTNPSIGGGALFCTVRESITSTFHQCLSSLTTVGNTHRDINGTMFAGGGFLTTCNGFRAANLPFFNGVLALGESRTASPASPSLVGTIFTGFSFDSITID
jgi:hypothetical protein